MVTIAFSDNWQLLRQRIRDVKAHFRLRSLEHKYNKQELKKLEEQAKSQEVYAHFRSSLLLELDYWFYERDARVVVFEAKPWDDGLNYDDMLTDEILGLYYTVEKTGANTYRIETLEFQVA